MYFQDKKNRPPTVLGDGHDGRLGNYLFVRLGGTKKLCLLHTQFKHHTWNKVKVEVISWKTTSNF